ncbi:hypothetical protein COU77_02130 [Candidatus Peregrinibacteria bacterium CG10_big_fil_rev_8_21_14_0_10_49_16]|nr:MAG: hypothetical protein COW95_01250 [Candidatus Peregrinibacteria bacterium CG22_combo_CG10-13_8_21_14_all_49_11]PIR52115.1 MAG: hypothetical protein COU77_02130 [Candidatus Peregrinibacteria bacterium CG10_big_fil_rev_8_21_14_0_10_49_16]
MKLFIITQKVDRRDPILGFFHRWVEEFAQTCDKVTVIGLSVGEYALPSNVVVETLGKDWGVSKIFQLCRFWWLQWKLRKEYDVVLVHMTPIWVVLGWKMWWLFRKPVYLWYEARGTKWPLRFSLLVARKVFSASEYGMPLPTKKSIIVGHGIDTKRFCPDPSIERDPTLLVTVGRITRAKRLDVLLRTLHALPPQYHLTVVGMPITADDSQVLSGLQEFLHNFDLHDRVTISSLEQPALVLLLQRAGMFLHASETSLDKAVLEACACECPVVSLSSAVQPELPERLRVNDENMATKVEEFFVLPEEKQSEICQQLRRNVTEKHGLPSLVRRLVGEMTR